ncbi:MAG: hypothetical protein U0T77_08960 [Chitinophagales bacterium]
MKFIRNSIITAYRHFTGMTIDRNILLVLSILFLYACNQQEEGGVAATGNYFDLTSLVKKDIKYNTSNNCREEKSVYLNANKETKQLDSIDWKKELEPLIECDINKPAWKGKFFADTVKTTVSGITSIQYRALSEKVNVKSMIIELKENEIQRIYITKKINSFIFSTVQIIEYFPGKGFSIRGEQKAILMRSFDLNVDVKYICTK